jgi:hypothetical protein
MFSSREIAIGIWLIILAIAALLYTETRQIIFDFVSIFLSRLVFVLVALIYTVGVVSLLASNGFWRVDLAKDTVIWFVFSALPVSFTYMMLQDESEVVKSALRANLGTLVLVEFIINTQTYSLWLELLVLPFASFVVMLDAFVSLDDRHKDTASLTGWVLTLMGLWIGGRAIYGAIVDYESYISIGTVSSILLPLLLAVFHSPLNFCILSYRVYVHVFSLVISGPPKSASVVRYVPMKVFLYFRLHLRKIREFSEEYAFELSQIRTREDVRSLLDMATGKP